MKFKEIYTHEIRLDEANRVMSKYKGRFPIVVEISDNNLEELNLVKKKYLVPGDLTVSQFIFTIRKRLKIEPEKALFIFFDNKLPASSALIYDVYNEFKSDDNFLYANIALETTFG
jgi:GABA(A) receptor-associated protein